MSSGNHGIHRDGRPDGRQWRGPLEKVTQQAQMVFIQELIYLDQLTYKIAGILTRTRDTSFLWRLRSWKCTICLRETGEGRGKLRGGQGHEQSPSSGLTETERSVSYVTGWIVSPTESKGYAAIVSPSTSEGDLMWKQDHCKCNLSTWDEAIQSGPGLNPTWMTSLEKETSPYTHRMPSDNRRRAAVMEMPARGCPGWAAVTRSQEELRKDPLQVLAGGWHCLCLDFGLLASTTLRRNFCCCQPPSLWNFVTAALSRSLKYTLKPP